MYVEGIMTAVSPITDLEALLKPISQESSAGQNLRHVLFDQKKGIYWHDRIREAHRENIYEEVPKLPDWPVVIDLSTQALNSLTKDLQIAAWLSDALVKHNGHDRLAGLRDSLILMRRLIEDYWDEFFPERDPEGDDGFFKARANIIAAFDTRMGLAIRAIPLIESMSGLRYSLMDWEVSRSFDIPEKDEFDMFGSGHLEMSNLSKEQAVLEGKITGEDWRKGVNGTPYHFIKERLELLQKCNEELNALAEAMDLRFEREAPVLRELRRSLEDMTSLMKKLEREKRPPDVTLGIERPLTVGDADSPNDEAGGFGLPADLGSIRTRHDALRRLADIAQYFRRTEPHSPVSYLVQRAIKWGNMPLDVWLEDVVKEMSVLGQLRETLGIKANNSGD
jgi:type VI secretion system protein ImpA